MKLERPQGRMKTMKRLLAIFAATMLLAGAANAADILGVDGSLLDPPSHAKFTGLYGGLIGGGEIEAISAETFDGISADGLIGGGVIGFDAACGAKLRCGAWIEGGVSNVATTFGSHNLILQDYFGAAGVRLGVVHGNSLIYARAGYQLAEWSSDLITVNISTQSWMFGGGIETELSKNLSIGANVDYLLLNDVSAGGTDYTDYVDADGVRATVRFIYRP